MFRFLVLIAITLGFSTAAFAHHPLAGMPMNSFGQGMLSGLAHPVIGIDHLFFVMSVGVLAWFAKSALTAPFFYLAGMISGVAVIISGAQLAYVELIIAFSLVVSGAIVISGKSLSKIQAQVLFATLGLFHGYAFGESIAGAEALSAQVLTGYLIGLSATQWLVAVLAGYFASYAWTLRNSADLRPRLLGAVTLGVGITFVVEIFESMLLTAG